MLQRFKKVKFIIILLVAVLGVFAFRAFSQMSETVLVERVEVENVSVKKTVSGSGEVKSLRQAQLSFPSGGRINAIYVKEGELVNEGKLMAQLYGYPTFQNAQAAKDARDIAKREKELFEEQYKDKSDKDTIGGQTAYEIQLRALNEAISRAEANYQASLGTITSLNITAPFSGTVIDTHFEVGESASPGLAVITLADLNNLVFEMTIDQEDYGVLRAGQKVNVYLDSFEDIEVQGELLELPSYAGTDGTSNFLIKVKLNHNAEVPVLLGMTGDGTITIEQTTNETNALLFDKVFEDNDGSYIWVADGNIAKKKYVETGLSGDLYTQILTDISQDTIIVPVQDTQIEDGSNIRFNN